MKNRSTAIALAAMLLTALPTFALSETRKETFIVTEGKHPTALQHLRTVPQDSDGKQYLCFGYANDGKFGDVGYLRGVATITRVDPDTGETTTEKIKKRGKLRKNRWLRCVKTDPVRAGDSILWDYELNDFRRIRGETIHLRSSFGQERMLARELRGPGATGTLGEPTTYVHRLRTNRKGEGKHPKSWRQAFVMPLTSITETLQFCFGYGNDFPKASTGKMKATAEITRTDPDTGNETVEKFNVSDNLSDNKARKCREIGRLNAGDMVVVDYEFEKFPKMRGNGFQIKTGIGPEIMRTSELFGPNPSVPDFTPGDGDGPLPDGSGDISGADQLAASALLVKSKKTQLWRFKNNQPKHWTVIGPKTQLGDGLGGVNPATTGYGDTIAEAVADYERKMGKLPAGMPLTGAEVAALQWYSDMKTNGGPTSCRRDGGGGYHGEYYRPGKGSVVVGGLKGIVGCIDFFKAQGL